MLYVDGMNGVIGHPETIQWLYTLIGSKFRLVVKTALKLLLVFVEYSESNAVLLIKAVNAVDMKKGTNGPWSNAMEILSEKDGVDTELLVYTMSLINKTLAALPDQDSFYDLVDCWCDRGAGLRETPQS
uniref:GBD/FH3 domain-containing protein n=1 Tax=Astyanax mexicanus TaxID=7994 RepID=A0A8B9HXJ0_ASTMX